MEADHQVLKHLCKLCNRSFPCGRSLGGHMRSHLMNNQGEAAEKLKKMKLNKFLGVGNGIDDGYSLRKNPKKTSRLGDFSDATTKEERFCRECGKGFQSWKALFGHMKCHSTETEKVSSDLELDSQSSDNEIPSSNRGKRSRRQTRYMAMSTTSSSFSFANAASSSVSDQNDQEQEEVALCLMMLSRDVSSFYSITHPSENDSIMHKQVPSLVLKNQFSKVEEGLPSVSMRSKFVKLNKFQGKKSDFREIESGKNLKFQGSNSEISASVVKIKNSDKSQHGDRFGLLSSKETGLNQPQILSSKLNTKELKFHESSDREVGSSSLKKSTHDDHNSGAHKNTSKRSKFQCNSCDKVFYSYQALGGHRASHKKTKPGLASNKTESSENSIHTEFSNDPTFESNPTPTPPCYEIENQQEMDVSYEKKNRNHHECSICFRIFSSGQALGGHKRSHLTGGSESRNKPSQKQSQSQTAVVQKPEAEIRDFLDLNLPAPVDEEGNNHLASLGTSPWWVGGSHQHEQPLVGLI